MKKECFERITVRVDDEVPYDMRLSYYLLTGEVSSEYSDLKVYGVEIDKEIISGIKSGRERKLIKDLFFKKCEAISFLETISRNKVTPMELKYVIKDYICQQIKVVSVNNT